MHVEVRFRVVVTQSPGGRFLVAVPDLPEVCTEGDSIAEAHRNAEEAILCAIEARLDLGMAIPHPTSPASDTPEFVARIACTEGGWVGA